MCVLMAGSWQVLSLIKSTTHVAAFFRFLGGSSFASMMSTNPRFTMCQILTREDTKRIARFKRSGLLRRDSCLSDCCIVTILRLPPPGRRFRPGIDLQVG